MSEQNKIQIGGSHYKTGGEEHWDRVNRLDLDYFQGQITKYVERWKKKNGVQDLEKARHFLDKYLELNTPPSTPTPVEPVARKSAPDMIWVRMGDVKATGWRQFLFEGADSQGFLFTCRECLAKFYALPDDNPHDYHKCDSDGAEPGRGYVDQG